MSGPIIIRSDKPVLIDKVKDSRVIIRPGQKALVIDPVTHKRHYLKGSVELAFNTGIQDLSNESVNYIAFSGGLGSDFKFRYGTIEPEVKPKLEVQGAKDNEIEIQSGVYLETKK